MTTPHGSGVRTDRRSLLSIFAGIVGAPPLGALARAVSPRLGRRSEPSSPLLVGSANALPGMEAALSRLDEGAAALDAALDVVSRVEADPEDTSVGLGGLPNEDGVVQLDAACMDGETHNSGAVAALENVLHPSRVARLVMERTDHCMLVGRGAYEFARMHGHEHVELLTERARRIWLAWKETASPTDDRLPPPPDPAEAEQERTGARIDFASDFEGSLAALDARRGPYPHHGTVHCSALSGDGRVACSTTTSGLAFKVPGRVGDSPVVGAGLYCDAEGGSAGATGRGEAAILAHASAGLVDLLRRGEHPLDAGMEILRRVSRQTARQAAWQPRLVDDEGRAAFGLKLYALDLEGRHAGVSLRGEGQYAVADSDGARLEALEVLAS